MMILLGLLMSAVSAVLFGLLARRRVVDHTVRLIWMSASGLLASLAVVHFIHFTYFAVPTNATAVYSMLFQLAILCTAGLVWKTLSYIETVNTINDLSIVDDTTGVYNQIYLEQRLNNEIARCHRYGSPLSVVSLSVIGFAALQEEFGHQAGSVALKKIATKLLALLRETDVVTFVGHGRYVLILPDTPESSVEGLITRLHGALDGIEVINGAVHDPVAEQSVFINVKFGKSHCGLQTEESSELVKQAVAREAPVTNVLAVAA